MKVESKERYSAIVERSFNITHAAADVSGGYSEARLELHALINNKDILLCHLHPSNDVLQQSLDLLISEGEAITLYVKASTDQVACVHLSGYLVDEPTDSHWESEFTEEEEDEEEEDEEEDGMDERHRLTYQVKST